MITNKLLDTEQKDNLLLQYNNDEIKQIIIKYEKNKIRIKHNNEKQIEYRRRYYNELYKNNDKKQQIKACKKAYYLKQKEVLTEAQIQIRKEKNKNYYELNKDKIKEKRKEKRRAQKQTEHNNITHL